MAKEITYSIAAVGEKHAAVRTETSGGITALMRRVRASEGDALAVLRGMVEDDGKDPDVELADLL